MTEYRNIIVVQANEAGQPTNLLALGENDTIADEVLSPEVRDAATKADEALTKANEVSGKNDEVSSYINDNQAAWEEGLDAVTRADIVTTSNALVGFQNTSGPAIKLSYESNADVTPFTPASATKFNNIEAGATNNQGALADLNTITNTEINTNAGITVGKLEDIDDGIILGNFTGDTDRVQKVTTADARASLSATPAQIKLSYETVANPFTDAEQTKLSIIEDNATADQTDSEIETAYNNQVAQVSTGEKTAGTATGVRRFSPKDIADMAGTHGGGGGGGGIPNPFDTEVSADGNNLVGLNLLKGPDNGDLNFSSNDNIRFYAGPYDGGSTAASGNVTWYAKDFLLGEDPQRPNDFPIFRVGKSLLVTDTSAVNVSGWDGTTVDAPPNGAALVLDTAQGLFKYQKIQSGNIGVGVIVGGNIAAGTITGDNIADNSVSGGQIADGTIGDNQIGTISIDDHTSLGSIGLNRLVGGGNETFLGRTATTGPNGPMEYMTKEQARTILNGGNQEITGNVGINTAATPTAPLQIEDTGTDDAIYIESSDAGSDAGPVITLKRDSASPAGADYLGQLKFKGESSTGAERVYAKITAKIDDPTNGSEDGALEIANRYNGANQIAVRLKEDSFRLLNSVELHVDGNTGLGTNNPSEKLDVQGNIAVTGTVDGRDIATDGTKLDGIEGAFAVGTTAPTSPSEGDLWYNTTTDVDELFAYDSGRSKWLGVNSFCINAGRTGTIGSDVGHFGIMDNREMNVAVGTKAGFQVPFDCTVVGWAWSAGTNTSGWMHRIARYDDSAGTTTQNVYTYSPAGSYDNWEQLDLDIDYDTRDMIGYSAIVATSPTGTIVNQNLTIIIKRRTS